MNEIIKTNDISIENMIYEIRGKQVMLDSDLALLYGVETKRINEAIKRNTEKFPERFSWILTDIESKTFLVANCDQKIETRGRKSKNPRVFTEQGVAMISTILKSKTAVEVSIRIMDAFVSMRHYIKDNINLLPNRILNIENKLDNNTKLIEENTNNIELLFNKFDEKIKTSSIYFEGQIYDAYSKILDIFKSSKKQLIIIDNYADNKVLDMIRNLTNIKVTIICSNKYMNKAIINAYSIQYNNLKVIVNNCFHDRYFIIDNKTIYHCGSSINRIGYKTFGINIIEDIEVKELKIKKINEII